MATISVPVQVNVASSVSSTSVPALASTRPLEVPELLSNILSQLTSFEDILLRASLVSKFWKATIDSTPTLLLQTFRWDGETTRLFQTLLKHEMTPEEFGTYDVIMFNTKNSIRAEALARSYPRLSEYLEQLSLLNGFDYKNLYTRRNLPKGRAEFVKEVVALCRPQIKVFPSINGTTQEFARLKDPRQAVLSGRKVEFNKTKKWAVNIRPATNPEIEMGRSLDDLDYEQSNEWQKLFLTAPTLKKIAIILDVGSYSSGTGIYNTSLTVPDFFTNSTAIKANQWSYMSEVERELVNNDGVTVSDFYEMLSSLTLTDVFTRRQLSRFDINSSHQCTLYYENVTVTEIDESVTLLIRSQFVRCYPKVEKKGKRMRDGIKKAGEKLDVKKNKVA